MDVVIILLGVFYAFIELILVKDKQQLKQKCKIANSSY